MASEGRFKLDRVIRERNRWAQFAPNPNAAALAVSVLNQVIVEMRTQALAAAVKRHEAAHDEP